MRRAEAFARVMRAQFNAYERSANGGLLRHVGIHSFLTVVEETGQRDTDSCAGGSTT